MRKEALKITEKNDEKTELNIGVLHLLVATSPFLTGVYFEYLSCAVSLVLIGWLFYAKKVQGGLTICKNLTCASLIVLSLSFLICSLWAVDRGMALLGFVKFLPLPLFTIALYQISPSRRSSLLRTVPYSGAAMTVISGVLGLFAKTQGLVLVNSRLAGFFQYPNTFALFLLMGLILAIEEKCSAIRKAALIIILIFGIFASGSRTGFVLLVLVCAALIVVLKDKSKKLVVCGGLALGILTSAIYVAFTGDLSSVGRYITTSFNSSTFLGRILYAKDSLPVILTHPFGLGYLGYFNLQGSFQTGVYSVVNTHNELVQMLLDVGWLPSVLIIAALVKSIKNGAPMLKLLLLTVTAHCMLDFDMQFIAIGLVAVLAMTLTDDAKELRISSRTVSLVGALLVCVSVYLGTASALYYMGQCRTAVSIYPGYTNAWKQLLIEAQDVKDADEIADQILRRNKSCSLAYSAKANAAYAEGDFAAVIENKEKAIELAKYSLEEYTNYFDMLRVGIALYEQNDDAYSAQYCREHLLAIPDMLDDVMSRTNPLAQKLDDKPELTLPDEYMQELALQKQAYEQMSKTLK